MTQTILITGASSGIGKATARYFAEKGWNVAATMRTPEKTADLVETDNLKKFRLDVQNKDELNQAMSGAIETFGKIDAVLNNAGYGTAGALETATDEQIRRQFEVNFFGLIDVMRAVLPHFRANKSGLFINVSSIGGLITFPLFSMYHASKWAVEGLSESLQYELNPLGIKLKIIEPGGVKTDFAGRSLDMFDATNFPDYQPTIEKMLANFNEDRMANYSTAEQIAEAIYNAATDSTDHLRYVCGTDAQAIWHARQQMPIEDFREMIRREMLG
jgi:NAD(P)-dependent dehydrogenase (short-subunit alcohol dehydrogenase family)